MHAVRRCASRARRGAAIAVSSGVAIALLAGSVAGAQPGAAPGDSSASSAARTPALAPPAAAPQAARVESAADSARAATLAFTLVPVADLVTDGVKNGTLIEPSGIAIDAFGRIYVGDAALHRVMRLDASGRRLGQSGTLGSSGGELRRPGGVTMLGTLNVAVLDIENRRVRVYDVNDRAQGTLIDFDDAALEDALGRIEPRELAADRGGALYVVDAERDRLLVFDFNGRWLRAIGGFGDAPGSFRGLAAVAVTRRGEIVTVERGRRRLQWFDASGARAGAWNVPDTTANRAGGYAVAVDDSLRIAVADERAGIVWVWDRAGVLLAEVAGFGRPRALAFAPDGTLVIGEAVTGRLRRFRLDPRTAPSPRAEE